MFCSDPLQTKSRSVGDSSSDAWSVSSFQPSSDSSVVSVNFPTDNARDFLIAISPLERLGRRHIRKDAPTVAFRDWKMNLRCVRVFEFIVVVLLG